MSILKWLFGGHTKPTASTAVTAKSTTTVAKMKTKKIATKKKTKKPVTKKVVEAPKLEPVVVELESVVAEIPKNKKLIIYDMRNIYSPKKIKKQGFKYFAIGR